MPPASITPALPARRLFRLLRRLLGRDARLLFHLDAVPLQRLSAALRRFQADAAQRALAIVLQQHVCHLFVVVVAAAHAERAALGDALDDAEAVQAVRLHAVARGEQLRVALQ